MITNNNSLITCHIETEKKDQNRFVSKKKKRKRGVWKIYKQRKN